MVRFILSCHVEPAPGTTNTQYLDSFIHKIRFFQKPVVLLLMVGERAGKNVVSLFAKNKKLIPANCPVGLHVHETLSSSLPSYIDLIGCPPDLVSFGHWKIDNNIALSVSQAGIKTDLSYCAYRQGESYFHKRAFVWQSITEVPVSCDPVYPINPFTSWYHFYLAFALFFRYLFTYEILHLYFHSYDLYPESITKKLRWFLISYLPFVSFNG